MRNLTHIISGLGSTCIDSYQEVYEFDKPSLLKATTTHLYGDASNLTAGDLEAFTCEFDPVFNKTNQCAYWVQPATGEVFTFLAMVEADDEDEDEDEEE